MDDNDEVWEYTQVTETSLKMFRRSASDSAIVFYHIYNFNKKGRLITYEEFDSVANAAKAGC